MSFKLMNINSIGKAQQGFTLIEILVAVIILSIGMLGIASLQVQGLRNNQSAYLKSQATLLAYDIADRMRTNSSRAIAGDYDDFDTSGDVPSIPTCITSNNGCTETALATADMAEWAVAVTGSDNSIATLPDAQGVITRGNGNNFTISINWQETQWNEERLEKTLTTQTFSTSFNL